MGSTPITATVLDNITVPNMDDVCTMSYQYDAGVLATTTQTCSRPILYYAGYGVDIAIIVLVAWLVKKVLC